MLKNLAISSMINISAVSISSELLDILSEENYFIHSSFESGLNIKIGNILAFIGNKRDTLVPYGILLKEDDVEKIMESIHRDTSTFRWKAVEKKFVSSNITIEVNGSRKYSSKLNTVSTALEEKQISLIKDNIDLSLFTGFDLTIDEIITQKAKDISELQDSFMSKNKGDIEKVLKGWIGRGRGLTPSGDDFLQGILFANHIWPILSSEFLETIESLLVREFTTDISKNYFVCALRGLFTQPLIELYKSMQENNPLMVKRNIYEILRFGHTSGTDIIAGMYVGFITLEQRHKLD